MTKQFMHTKEENQVFGKYFNISIRLERDLRKIKKLISMEDLKKHLWSDDKKLKKELNRLGGADNFVYMMQEDSNDFGIVIVNYFKSLGTGFVECGVLKDYRGLKAKKAVNLIIKHIYNRNPSIKLIGRINKDNRKSYFFSKFFGFRLKNENSTHYVVTR